MSDEQDERLKVLVRAYCWTPGCSYPHCNCASVPPHMRAALAALDAHDAKRAREGVTEEMVLNAVDAFNERCGDRLSSMRAALEAVAPMLARGSAAPAPAAYPATVIEEMKKAAIRAFWRNDGSLDQVIGLMLAAALAVAPKPQCAPTPAETAAHPVMEMEGMKTAALQEHWRDEGAAAPKPETAPVPDDATLDRALAEAARAVSRNCGLPGDLRALAAAIEKRFGCYCGGENEMSKIEIYNAKKQISSRLAGDARRALGRDSPTNDKAYFSARFAKILNADFSPMQINIEMSHGYYGSSSAYSDTSEDMGRYLAAAITKHKALLLDTAVEMAVADAEVARIAAEEEANAVLLKTKPCPYPNAQITV